MAKKDFVDTFLQKEIGTCKSNWISLLGENKIMYYVLAKFQFKKYFVYRIEFIGSKKTFEQISVPSVDIDFNRWKNRRLYQVWLSKKIIFIYLLGALLSLGMYCKLYTGPEVFASGVRACEKVSVFLLSYLSTWPLPSPA